MTYVSISLHYLLCVVCLSFFCVVLATIHRTRNPSLLILNSLSLACSLSLFVSVVFFFLFHVAIHSLKYDVGLRKLIGFMTRFFILYFYFRLFFAVFFPPFCFWSSVYVYIRRYIRISICICCFIFFGWDLWKTNDWISRSKYLESVLSVVLSDLIEDHTKFLCILMAFCVLDKLAIHLIIEMIVDDYDLAIHNIRRTFENVRPSFLQPTH